MSLTLEKVFSDFNNAKFHSEKIIATLDGVTKKEIKDFVRFKITIIENGHKYTNIYCRSLSNKVYTETMNKIKKLKKDSTFVINTYVISRLDDKVIMYILDVN